MRLTLTLFDPPALMGGPTAARRFDRAGGTIGRAVNNDWVLPDPGHHLSDQHCRIEHRDGAYTLVDTSTTGVYVNESTEALGFGNARTLAAGDRIALGDYLLAVALDDGTDVAAAESPTPTAAPTADTPFVAPSPEPCPQPAASDAAARPESVAPSDMPPPRARPGDRLPSSGRSAAGAPGNEANDLLTLDPPLPRGNRADRKPRGTSRRGGRTENHPAHADAGANEYVAAFLDGVGLAAPELSRDQAIHLMAHAGAALRAAVAGMQDVWRGPAGTRARLGDNPLTDAIDVDETMASLLGLTRPARLPAEHAIRELAAAIKARALTARSGWIRSGHVALALLGVLIVLGAAAAAYHAFGPAARTAAVPPEPGRPEPAPASVAAAPSAAPAPPAPTVEPPTPPPAPLAAPVVASAPTPAPVDRTRLRGALSELFRSFACANLAAEIGDDGTVILTGFVSRDDELSRLSREIAALPHVPRVDSRATVEPWPSCEVARLLSTRTAGGPAAPQIEASRADRTYREGDALIVTATNHTRGDSYLYVDFFDTDGKVVHMLPTALRANNRVAANQRVALGATPGKAGRNERVYVISPPFGTGLLIALSSARRLFAELRPEQEDAGAYLAALAGALVRDPAGAGSAARVTSSQQAITLVAR